MHDRAHAYTLTLKYNTRPEAIPMLLWAPLSFRSRPWLIQCHLHRQKTSRHSPKMPKTHPGRRVRVSVLTRDPSQVAAQLTVFFGTQIALRLMVVVLYQFPLAFRTVQFPTDTARIPLLHRTRKATCQRQGVKRQSRGPSRSHSCHELPGSASLKREAPATPSRFHTHRSDS